MTQGTYTMALFLNSRNLDFQTPRGLCREFLELWRAPVPEAGIFQVAFAGGRHLISSSGAPGEVATVLGQQREHRGQYLAQEHCAVRQPSQGPGLNAGLRSAHTCSPLWCT